MAINQPLTSSHFPYLPIQIQAHHWKKDVEALLDTGFDGDVVVPLGSLGNGEPPDAYLPWSLADGSEVLTAAYLGVAQAGHLGSFPAVVIVLGDDFLIGRGLARSLPDHAGPRPAAHR